MSFYKQSSNYQQSKANASLRDSNEQRPLNSAQLNAVMRNVFAWMTVGVGISAWVASLISAGELDMFTIFTGFVIAIILQLGLAFALYGELPWFSPTRASCFLFIYSVAIGASFSMFFALFNYAKSPSAAITACLSVASLFAAMTLVGWKSNFDFSKRGSYILMGLIGLLLAVAINLWLDSGRQGIVVSLIGVAVFSALTAYMTQPIARMGAHAPKTVNPDDAIRLSAAAALKLYLSISILIVIMPIALLWRLLGGRYSNHGDSHYLFGDGIFSDDFGGIGGDDGGFGGFGGDDGGFGDFGGDDGGFGGDFGD